MIVYLSELQSAVRVTGGTKMAENGLGSDAGSQDNLAAEAISLDIEEVK